MKRVAFLRGLNVGTGHRLTMERLRELFVEAGCTGVTSFQAAGNVIFDGPGPGEAAIEAVLRDGLGYAVPTYVRTTEELAAVASSPPFPGLAPVRPSSLHVTFLKDPVPPEARRAIEAAANDVDVLRVVGRELYWFAGVGVLETTLDWKAIARHQPDLGTTRNITTVRKLAAKHPPA